MHFSAAATSCIPGRSNASRALRPSGRLASHPAQPAQRSKRRSAAASSIGHFKFIVAAGETFAGKPAPDPYARAAELHGVAPGTCVAIEDSRWGIESAKAAGLWCIAITHTYPVAELFEADAIVTSLNELTPQLIKGLA